MNSVEEYQVRELINDICRLPKQRLYNLSWNKLHEEDAYAYLCNGYGEKYSTVYPLDYEPTEDRDYGVDGIKIDSIFIDIDNDSDIDIAINDAKIVYDFLTEQGLEVLANVSGAKGSHLRVLFNEIELKHPKETIIRFQKRIEEITGVKLDDSVYSRIKGIMRLPLSYNQKSGCYAHFLDFNDVDYLAKYHKFERMPYKQCMQDADYFVPKRPSRNNNNHIIASILIAIDNQIESECSNEPVGQNISFTVTSDNEFIQRLADVYQKGHMYDIGYPLINLLILCGWEDAEILDLFNQITPNGVTNKAPIWLDRQRNWGYNTDLKFFLKRLRKVMSCYPQLEDCIDEYVDYFNTKFKQEFLGLSNFGNYKQKEGYGIYHEDNNKDEPTPIRDTFFVIHNGTRIKDALGIFNDQFTINYENIHYPGKVMSIEGSYSTILDELKEGALFVNESVAGTIMRKAMNSPDIMEFKEEVFKTGFFLLDGHVIRNTPIDNLEYTLEDVGKAIQLLNNILAKNKHHEAIVYRWMLSSPFLYCLKQLGKFESCKHLILEGESNTNKTGVVKSGYRLYGFPKPYAETIYSTIPFLSEALENSSFPLLVDEADSLFEEKALEREGPFFKNNVTNTIARAKMGLGSGEGNERPAVSPVVYTMNYFMPNLKGEILKRYDILDYGAADVLYNEEVIEFQRKYQPDREDSVLSELKYLGAMFSDKMIPYIESNSIELYDYENLVIDILKQIQEEVGVDFDINFIEARPESRIDKIIDKEELFRQVLIKLFLDKSNNVGVKQYDSPTTRLRKILSTNSIPWIYTKRQGGIAVDVKKMCNYVNPIAQTSFSPESALKVLGIKCDFIDQMWFRGKNISYGIDLDEQEVLAHIFNQCDKNEGLIIESQEVREE